MGILTDGDGRLDFDLIEKIDKEFGRRLRNGEAFNQNEIDELARKANDSLSKRITEYENLLSGLAELCQDDSYGLPTGHEGLNNLFWTICIMALDVDRLRKEIYDALNIPGNEKR